MRPEPVDVEPKTIEALARRDFDGWLDARLELQARAPQRLERLRRGAASRCRLLVLGVLCGLAFLTWLLLPLVAELVGAYR